MQARAAAARETRTTPPRTRRGRDSLPPRRSSATPGTAARRRWPGTREHRRPAHHTLIRRLAPALDCITAAAVPARAECRPRGATRQCGAHRASPHPRLTGHGHLVPEPAVEVEAVAEGLAGGGATDVGVQRRPVVGALGGPVGPLDRPERAADARARRGGPGHRRPVAGARPVTG